MIYYTLQGPGYQLEIHDEQIRLIKKNWFRAPTHFSWDIKNLSDFEILVPKFLLFSGKLHWQTFDGEKGSFRFSTSPVMVKKIESYLQKRIIKNHQQKKRSAEIVVTKDLLVAA